MRHIAFCTVVLALAVATRATALDLAKDYVTGQEIAVDAKTPHAEANGATFWFGSEDGLKAFQAAPDRFYAAASQDHGWWIGKAWSHYFAIRKTLASDSVEGILPHAKAMGEYAAVASKLHPDFDEEGLKEYVDELTAIATTSAFPEEPTLETARLAFKGLSVHVVQYVRKVASREDLTPAVFLFHCGMAKASWAQETDDVGNPYFGRGMLKCGDPVSPTEDFPYDPEKGCPPGGCHDGKEGSGGC